MKRHGSGDIGPSCPGPPPGPQPVHTAEDLHLLRTIFYKDSLLKTRPLQFGSESHPHAFAADDLLHCLQWRGLCASTAAAEEVTAGLLAKGYLLGVGPAHGPHAPATHYAVAPRALHALDGPDHAGLSEEDTEEDSSSLDSEEVVRIFCQKKVFLGWSRTGFEFYREFILVFSVSLEQEVQYTSVEGVRLAGPAEARKAKQPHLVVLTLAGKKAWKLAFPSAQEADQFVAVLHPLVSQPPLQ
mmetsp:Transcript_41858/g.105580  ORF Transcript_41858/g.105580 Transcript_41858/m.105580 type:complete len:242 (-) Transcript_41858:237-962(-)|eukprot:CAMPEP_0177633442 /NCGR_PEP_ID=MMETSP0447-20121125/2839_1 /TAXON_ID=0 /ORGANISM="Stygamoeba regulata, Strain BSH-02190019" /LENGTH=241 /DNA_ID=CAMNT_0019135101 /DNA_START=126 /DNA_END=851 /DNA_ORIENTATION=-